MALKRIQKVSVFPPLTPPGPCSRPAGGRCPPPPPPAPPGGGPPPRGGGGGGVVGVPPRPYIRALGPPLGAGMMRIIHRQKEPLTAADGVAPFAHCSQCSQCIYWVYWERFIIIASHRTGIHWQHGDRSQCGGGPCTGNGWSRLF